MDIVRRLLKTPTFTAATLLTLAIGIGANTAIFGVVNGILLKPLPFPEPDRLAVLRLNAPGMNEYNFELSPAVYFLLREESKTLIDVGLWRSDRLVVNGLAEPEQVDALDVTPSVLRALQVKPMAGRAFTDQDGIPGSPLTALVTYPYLLRRFGGLPSNAIGKRVLLDYEAFEIVGVLPPEFRFLNSEPMFVTPLQWERGQAPLEKFFYPGIARLKPGITWEQVNAEAAQLLPLLPDRFPPAGWLTRNMFFNGRFAPAFRPLKQAVVGDVGTTLWILTATIGVLLLIACANVANLLLVRAEDRQQEMAIRAALGASWGDLAMNFLAESVSLSFAGGLLGLGVAHGLIKLLTAIAPAGLPRLAEIAIDPAVFAFCFSVSLLAGVSFGLVPVWRYARPGLETVLRNGGRGASVGRGRLRTRALLIVTQIALASVLLVGAGLMIRTAVALSHVKPGFRNPEQVLTASLALPEVRVGTNDQVIAIYQEMLRKVREIPGVASAAIGWSITLDGSGGQTQVFTEGRSYGDDESPPTRRYKVAGPGLFNVMGNPMIAGRDFTWDDVRRRMPCAILSEGLARELWGDPPRAVGKRIRESRESPWREVIGVVGDERDDGLNKPAAKTVHWPLAMVRVVGRPDRVQRFSRLVVRSPRAGSEAFLNEVKSAVWSAESATPVAYVRTLKQIMGASLARTSFTLILLVIAGGMALLLVVIGVYGVVAYSVAQRTGEIGIRSALGATPRDIGLMVFRQALSLAGFGLAIGLAASLALTRWMSALLYGVRTNDIWTLVAIGLIIGATVLLASCIPARRATRIDPADALRNE